MAQDARLFSSAKLVAVCTVASRITGLARDILLNRAYGQGWVQDAFNYGFLIPNLFRRLFGEGALSAVFVPVFTDVLDKKGRPTAWHLLGRVTGLMTVALLLLTVLLEAVLMIAWHVAGKGRELHIGLTAVMAPFMIGVCILALFSSILNCLRKFALPALLPIVLNVMMILGVAFIGPAVSKQLDRQVYVVAACTLAAAALQLVIIIPALKREGVDLQWSLRTDDPDLRRILRTFVPIVIGQGILVINVFFDSHICTILTQPPGAGPTGTFLGMAFNYPLTKGALSALNNAQRLYQFPLGVLAISLATVALPTFSLHAARGQMEGLRSTFGQTIRMAIFEGLPSGLMLIVLAVPIVSLLFEHGRFGPEQTQRAATVLQWYGLGMAAFCSQHILLRAFYSLNDTLTPMWISCGLVLVNWAISLSLVWRMGESAFAIGTSVTTFMHIGLSVLYLRRRMGGRMGARAIVGGVSRTVIASAAAAMTAWALWYWSTARLVGHHGLPARAVLVFLPLGGAIGVYMLAAGLMRMEEFRWLFGRTRAAQIA